MNDTTIPVPLPSATICTAWVVEYVDSLDQIGVAAVTSAAELRRFPDSPCGVDLSPGNGWRYKMVATLIEDDALAAHLGGDLLISLPEFHRCLLLARNGMHVPGYVEEKLKLGRQHSAILAAYTTLLSDALAVLDPADLRSV